MKRWLFVLAVCSLGLAFWAAPPAAIATHATDQPHAERSAFGVPESIELEAQEALIGGDLNKVASRARSATMKSAAAEAGQSAEQFARRAVPLEDMSELNVVLEQQYGHIWTNTARAPDGSGYDYDVTFTEDPPPDLLALLASSSARIRIFYGAPYTSAELMLAQSAILRAAPAMGVEPQFIQIITSPHATTLGVFIGGNQVAEAETAELAKSLQAQFVPDKRGVPLSVIVVNDPTLQEPASEMDAVKGGYHITGCTSGFGAVRPSTGSRGLVTAKHCPDPPFYFPLNRYLGGAVNGAADTDTQFNAAPDGHTANAKFQANTGIEFTVSSVGNPSQGDPVSKYGNQTQRTDGSVTNPSTCYTGQIQQWCNVFLTSMDANDGDSGAPCFSAGAALGILSGGITTNVNCTKISAIPASATILQQ